MAVIQKHKWFILFYLILIVFIAVKTLNTNYVEGDDASTILYHLMGRNTEIQQPFNPYHSGFDLMLSHLPQNETLLRHFAVYVSFLTGFLSVIILLIGLRFIVPNQDLVWQSFALLLPFIVPEIIFNGLIINPTNVGFLFCALALLAYVVYHKTEDRFWLLFIPLCFLIGISFRWSLLAIFFTFVGFWLFHSASKKGYFTITKKDWRYVVSMAIALVLAFVGIWITGHSPAKVFEVMLWGTNYTGQGGYSYSVLAANGMSFFTPALLVLVIVGFVYAIQQKGMAAVYLLLFSILPFVFLGIDTSFKYLITLLPVILVFAYYGFTVIWQRMFAKIAFLACTAAVWIFGIQLTTVGTDYGPGFEIGHWVQSNTKSSKTYRQLNPDKRLSINQLKIVVGSGYAMPTVEGPRPLFGYATVLFFGEWYRYIEFMDLERKQVFSQLMKKESSVLWQDKRFSVFQCHLFSQGFISTEVFRGNEKGYNFRVFSKNNQKIKIVSPKQYDNWEDVCQLMRALKPDIIYTSTTTLARKVQECGTAKRISPNTFLPIE